MLSKEKLKQSLASSNTAVLILNIIFLIFGLFGVLGLVTLAMNLEEFIKQVPDQEAVYRASLTPLAILGVVATVTITATIVILSWLNRKRIQNNQPSKLPYYLGAALQLYTCLTNIFSLFLAKASTGILLGLGINLALLALYVFVLYKINQLEKAIAES